MNAEQLKEKLEKQQNALVKHAASRDLVASTLATYTARLWSGTAVQVEAASNAYIDACHELLEATAAYVAISKS